MRQVETSRSAMFDARRHARGFFEALVTDNRHRPPGAVQTLLPMRCRGDRLASTYSCAATTIMLGIFGGVDTG
jgi:hypothetical protein